MKSGFYYYNVGRAQNSMPSFETLKVVQEKAEVIDLV